MWLRQSTASQEIKLGPFPDSTDGDTAETGLTIANTDIKLTKGGATTETNKNSGGGTHVAGGRYSAVLDATDTDTLGILEVDCHVAGALAVHRSYLVVPAVVYDAVVLGTDNLDVNVAQWLGTAVATPTTAGVPEVDVTHVSGDSTAADNLELQYDTTGLTGDTFPATQAQIGNLSTGSGGISTTAASFTKAGAEPETNTYTSTVQLDGTFHIVEDDTTSTDAYYQFDVGTDGVPQEVVWEGYAQSNGDSYTIHFYNWAGTSWDQVGTISAVNGTTVISEAYTATIAHVGTGTNAGLVRFRFLSSDGTAFATDRLYCTYTQIVSGIANGSTITLAASTTNENFVGHNWSLALGGQDISGSHFEGANVSGVASGSSEASFTGCHINGTTLPPSHLHNCTWLSTITLASAGNFTFTVPSSEVAGAGAPVLNMNSVGAGTTVNIRGLKGGLTVNNLTTNHVLTIGGTELGTITLNGADASVEIRGIYKALVNNLTGSPTVNSDGAILAADVAAILADTNELQTNQGNWLTATGFATETKQDATDIVIGELTTQGDTNETKLDTVDANVDILILGIITGAAATGTLSTTQASSDLAGYTDDQLIGRIITVTSGVAEGESSDITDYVETNGVLTFTAMTLAMGNTDTFKIT